MCDVSLAFRSAHSDTNPRARKIQETLKDTILPLSSWYHSYLTLKQGDMTPSIMNQEKTGQGVWQYTARGKPTVDAGKEAKKVFKQDKRQSMCSRRERGKACAGVGDEAKQESKIESQAHMM